MKKPKKVLIFKQFNENEANLVECKKKTKVLIYYLILLLVLLLSIVYSFFSKGFLYTLDRILLLIVCAIGGFAFFYLLYGIFIFVDYFVTKIKNKKVFIKVSLPQELNDYYENNKFTYNRKLSFKLNFELVKKLFVDGVEESIKYGKKTHKYVNFDYSIDDVLCASLKIIDDVYIKVDGVLGKIKIGNSTLNNKPISFVEKKLTELIANDDEDKKEEVKENNFFSKIKDTFLKNSLNFAGIVFKNPIEDLVNDLFKYAINTSFDLANGNISKEENHEQLP